ncbi:MAG: LodA/GoxA family CTQ-dependent oxidase [Wenzhouxiangellaceae bacterium]
MSLDNISYIRIHPGIGMARVGNSPDFYIGPEAPYTLAEPGDNSYKDNQQRMKRQAQRFRIYAYDAQGNVLGELSQKTPNVKTVEWKVHVRNLKAANYAFEGAYLYNPDNLRNPSIQPGLAPIERDQLIVDAGVQTIASHAGSPVVLQGTIFDGIEGNQTLPGALKFEGKDTQPGEDVAVTYRSAEVTLGELHLDEADRLLFVAGPGVSECVTTPAVVITNPSEHWNPPNGPNPDDWLTNQFSYFNVPGWYDDTCGGSIDVTVTMDDGAVYSTLNNPGTSSESRDAKRGAWIVTAPPKYVPGIYHVVSILDRVYETFPEADPNNGKQTEFYRDIYPILENASNSSWVSGEAFGAQGTAHGPGQPGDLISPENLALFDNPNGNAAARQQIYNIMRHTEGAHPGPVDPPPTPAPPPRKAGEGPVYNGNLMPKLWGTGGKPLQNQQLGNNLPDQYLSLTTGQLARMKDWADGNYVTGEKIQPTPLEQLPLAQQPTAMDEAALQPTIGGGFHPGIEFPYLIVYQQYFAEAFRVAADVEPGSVAAYMSCPWQGDFWSCNTAWWPAQRPDIVVEFDGEQRVAVDWFRGCDPTTGQPLSSTDGYDQMVQVWWQLGMVVATDQVIDGETVFKEIERNPALDGE